MKKLLGLVAVFALCFVCAAVKAEDKTYKPNDEGFIMNWLVLEPIELDDKASNHDEDNQKEFFAKEFWPGMKKCTPKDGEKVKVGGKDLAFKATTAGEFAVDFGEVGNSMFCAVTYITADAEMAGVKLAIGSDDSSIWYLNGKEVIKVYSGRGVEKDQDTSGELKLEKGVNILFSQTINGGGPGAMCARFLGKDGNPVKNLTISLTPPAK